jgi:hypothetical protein
MLLFIFSFIDLIIHKVTYRLSREIRTTQATSNFYGSTVLIETAGAMPRTLLPTARLVDSA